MIHFIFFVLHVAAVLFGLFGLFITIPLHLIASIMMERNERERRYEQQEWLASLSDEDYQRYEDEQLGRRADKVIGLILFLVWLLWVGVLEG